MVRPAHHPEPSRRTISKFEFSNYLNKFWILVIWNSDLFRVSTCPPPVCLCHAIATASQLPVRYPLQAVNGSGQAGGYLNLGFTVSFFWKLCDLADYTRYYWDTILDSSGPSFILDYPDVFHYKQTKLIVRA